MIFNSLTFLIFFAFVVGVYYLPIPWTAKKIHLLLASYVFYAAWNPPFVLLLMLSTVVDWLAAKGIDRSKSSIGRNVCLAISLTANLGLLGFFKYGQFLLDNFVAAAALAGIHYSPPGLDIVLPVGISFYTFQTLSYTLDVYLGRASACKSFLDFALYVTFFPQLVAGPIVRATDFLPQCVEPARATSAQMGWGAVLLTLGLFQKVVLADTILAPVADAVYTNASQAGFFNAWMGTLAFSAQIFFDFSGYSLCAIGVAMCLGFALPDNFRAPYGACGFSDFWRRWHISLSTWLRDYLYIPLGGNRRGELQTYANLMVTMLLGGLWHGASWLFVVWGGLHGLFLAVERLLHRRRASSSQPRQAALSQLATIAATYILVCITWVFFRADSLETAQHLLRAMILGGPDRLEVGWLRGLLSLAVVACMLASHWHLRSASLEASWARLPWWASSGLLAFMLAALIVAPGDHRAFIYFQF